MVNKGDLFVALKGNEFDGHNFIDDAVKKGAGAIVSSIGYECSRYAVPLIYVRDARKALAILAKNFYRDPSKKIKIIGITGTNGKTTISYLMENILLEAGKSVGRLGTINYKIGEKVTEAVNTTPSSLLLNKLLNEMVKRSLKYAVMEVSSHSLDQHRTDKVQFDIAVFSNITREHLDYHRSFQKYLSAKTKLFSSLSPDSGAVLNAEDPHFESFKDASSSKRIMSFKIGQGADIKASDLKMDMNGIEFAIEGPKDKVFIKSQLIGRYNVSNILAATATAIMEGIDLKTIKKGIEGTKQIPGRLQLVKNKTGFKIFIDYAHTDDALKKVLNTLATVKKKNLIVVFGCGGQRDAAKRPRMGRVASNKADFVIITTDNPRDENPKLIAEEIRKGLKKNYKNYEIILDRKKAIKKAISIATDGDIVLIAGKGHEAYQIVGDKKIPFNDEEVVKDILKRRNK